MGFTPSSSHGGSPVASPFVIEQTEVAAANYDPLEVDAPDAAQIPLRFRYGRDGLGNNQAILSISPAGTSSGRVDLTDDADLGSVSVDSQAGFEFDRPADGRRTFIASPTTHSFLCTAAPADAALGNGECALWLDATPAATKLMIKAKDSAGTVRTAAIALA